MMNLNNKKDWLKLIAILIILICILVGYILGYFSGGDRSCIQNPLIYGIKIINFQNNDNFSCTCSSKYATKESFIFDETGIQTFSLR